MAFYPPLKEVGDYVGVDAVGQMVPTRRDIVISGRTITKTTTVDLIGRKSVRVDVRYRAIIIDRLSDGGIIFRPGAELFHGSRWMNPSGPMPLIEEFLTSNIEEVRHIGVFFQKREFNRLRKEKRLRRFSQPSQGI